MTIQVINVGAAPNDHTGDPIRTAFQKVNSNFSAIAITDVVLDFGADNTGVVDATSAFQAAANAYLYVYTPPGTYKITGQVNCGARPVCFECASRGSVIFNLSSSTDCFLWNGGSVTGGGIRHAIIDVAGMTGGYAISMKGQNRMLIDDLTIRSANTAAGAIYLEDINSIGIRNVWGLGSYGTNGAFIKAVGTTATSFNVLDLDYVLFGGSGGASSTSSDFLVLDGGVNTIDIRHIGAVSCRYGIITTNTASLTTFGEFITAYDAQFDGLYGTAIILGTSGTGTTGTHRFTDVYIHNNGANNSGTGIGDGHGVYVYPNCRETSFQGGIIVSCNLNGVYCDGNAIRMTDFKISKNSQQNVGNFPGFQLGPSSYECKIFDNMIGQHTGSSTSDMSYGVQLDALSKRNTVTGNTLQANVLGAILDNSADVNTVINNNHYAGNTTFHSALTPAVMSATHNNYNPTTWSVNVTHLRLTPAGGGTALNGLFTGASASTWLHGSVVLISNLSTADTLTVNHLNGGSNAWNQFSLAGAVALPIGPLANQRFMRDEVLSKWIPV